MLLRLEISDLAVISRAVFEPREGLNVISGETGAGKSLLIDAIGLILGSKASKNMIRTGADSAFVEAVFDISGNTDPGLGAILDDSGISIDDGLLIISRTVSKDGKSIARVNGRTVVLAVLRSIASCLVDIHGQHDTQKIFDDSVHVELLDSFGGAEIKRYFDEYTARLNDYKESVLKIRNLQASGISSGKRKEYLEFAVKEISEASLKEGEEETLKERKKILSELERSINGLTEADSLLNGDEDMCVVDRLGKAFRDISSLSSVDPSYKDLASRLESLYLEAQSACEEIRELAEKNPFDPEESSRIDKRLGLIYELQSKYGPTTSDVLKFCNDSVEELDSLKDINKRISELKKERAAKEALVLESARKLSEARKAKAELLCKEISSEFSDLMLDDASFEVRFDERPKERYFSSKGTDDIYFMFSANPGEEARELSRIASGGEASRIMLAIKNILSEADMIPTLIFDEIDTGVSGNAAFLIARKLLSISAHHQVLCVTHTSQLAAAADHNFLISKSSSDGRTSTTISALDGQGKVDEISRLMSGTDLDGSADVAKRLIDNIRSGI